MTSRKLMVGVLVLAVPFGLWAAYRPDRAIRTGTAAVADSLCAKTFVAGLDPDIAYAEAIERPGIRRIAALMRYHLDPIAKTVDVSVAGLHDSHAEFRDGFGCVLVHGSHEPYLLNSDIEALRTSRSQPLLPDIAGPDLVDPPDPALRAALDHVFVEPATPPYRRTKAVVVVRDGKVIAERYAAGAGIHTPLPSFSMTKSMINALLGILTRQGLLTPLIPAPIPEWRSASDPRHDIRIEQMMRMTTGLALDETNSGFDPSSQMYLYDDMAGFAVNAPLIAPPGKRWAYSSATTQLLARIIRDAVGGPEQTLALAWHELFNPLGMRDVMLQFDASGTLQGSNNMLASARDWARFGLLYLGDGEVGGRRILPEGWVDFSAAATLDTDYGAGFWTNRSTHDNARGRVQLGIPPDAFFASGSLGQRCVIIPSQHMVVVRMGDAADRDGDMRGLARLVKEAIAATHS
ncbi:serine hydrolase domain-containing protein [Bradyrhizobium sp.]|uniref:serine hydrolase domain-containing protein n=1 Tax=Bradyrhizobium sp. TaxID=376 RepID=UPI003C453F4A